MSSLHRPGSAASASETAKFEAVPPFTLAETSGWPALDLTDATTWTPPDAGCESTVPSVGVTNVTDGTNAPGGRLGTAPYVFVYVMSSIQRRSYAELPLASTYST